MKPKQEILDRTLYNKNFLSLAGNGSSAVFGLINFALLARTFNSSVFGEWIVYLATAGFIEMFRFGLTNSALVRFLSGADTEEKQKLIGSNYAIGIVITLGIVVILYLTYFIFRNPIVNSPYKLFFIWYPILAIVNLPFNNAITILQAEERFLEIFYIRLLNVSSFSVFLCLNYFLNWDTSLDTVILVHLVLNLLISVGCILKKWDGITYLGHTDKHSLKTLLNFGKFTTLTLVGSNLLRSADTFIISISPLGSKAVAMYAIPLKLTEMLQIPLRSFAAAAYPRLSRASIKNELGKFKWYFYSYTGGMTLLFIPIILVGFVFADIFVLILGGREYLNPELIPGQSTVLLFKIFVLYGIMLPLDRMTGVALNSMNKPEKDFYKVLVMVVANIIGDLIAVFIFKSLIGVALATWLFTFIGMVLGYHFINREINLKFSMIFKIGWASIIHYFCRKPLNNE